MGRMRARFIPRRCANDFMKREKTTFSAKKYAVWMIAAGLGAVALSLGLLALHSWNDPAWAFAPAALSSPGREQAVRSTSPPAQSAAAAAGERAQTEANEMAPDNSPVIHILLLGVDSDEYTATQNQGWRSDMMMLCTLNTGDGRIFMTSIPRDTRTYVYHVDKDGHPTEKTLTKINHAYSYGGGPDKYGAKNAMRAVSDYLGGACGACVPVDYYVSIDMENMPKLADALGGVPVTLDVDFPLLGRKGEKVVLDSSSVNYFLRNRYDVGGDLSRARHHEEFLLSLLRQIKAKGARYATALFGFSVRYTRTNLNFSQMMALAGLLDKSDLNALDYRVIAGEYRTIGGVCYYLSDAEDVKKRLAVLAG